MFKKTLLAAAILSAAGFANAASVVSNTLTITGTGGGDDIAIDVIDQAADVKLSSEGLAGAGKIALIAQTIADDNVTTAFAAGTSNISLYMKNDVAIQNGDFVYITLPGAVFDTAISPSVVELDVVGSANATDDDIDATDSNLSFIKYEGDSIVFGATATVPAGSVLMLNSAAVKTGSAASMTPAFKAVNVTIGDYAAGTAKKSFLVTSELANAKVSTSYDGVIDVSNERKQYTAPAGGDGSFADALTMDLTTTAVDKLALSALTYDVTITGDFTKLDTDGDMKLEAGEGSLVASQAVTTVAAADLSSVLYTGVTANAARTFTINLPATKANRQVLTTQDFTFAVISDYTATAAKADVAVTSGAAGKWSLNGSSDSIAFLPFGPAYSQSVTVTNTGTVDGEITIDITSNGTTHTTTLEQTAAAKSVVDISDAVRAWASTNGVSGNARVAVVVNSPSTDISVKGVYYSNTDNDRAVIY
jgi:hypothetical protein